MDIARYLNGDFSDWKSSFEDFCKKENLSLFLRSDFDINELPAEVPQYYKDSISFWRTLHKNDESNSSFLWYNKHLKIDNKTAYNGNLFQMGLWCIQDLYEDGKPIQFQFWRNKCATPGDYMVWRGLIQLTVGNKGDDKRGINRGYVLIKTRLKVIDGLKQIRET